MTKESEKMMEVVANHFGSGCCSDCGDILHEEINYYASNDGVQKIKTGKLICRKCKKVGGID